MTDSAPAGPIPLDPAQCERAVRRLWDYLDGRLPGIARGEVEAHLATCERCLRRFDFARTMRRVLASSAPPGEAGTDESRLRARVHSTLERLSPAPDRGDSG
jgi:anti-sigma factor (TIGR02949 family)